MGSGGKFVGDFAKGFTAVYSIAHPTAALGYVAGNVVGRTGAAAWNASRFERAKEKCQSVVTEWFVKPGETVKKDQLLCTVKTLKKYYGISEQGEVLAHFDGVVDWTYPLGQVFGWGTQLVGITETPKPAKPPSDTGRVLASAAARFARGTAAAANKVARMAEEVAAAKSAAKDDSAEKPESAPQETESAGESTT